MKYLIVYSHPNPKSFNHAIKEVLLNELEALGQEVRVRDLYAHDFDPVLRASDFQSFHEGIIPEDIKAEQGHISWAEEIIFIFPIWWTGLPAILKGYIDKVFSLNFAYSYGAQGPKGLLPDKKVFIINTTGSPQEAYEKTGMFKSLNQTVEDGIFRFCAMPITGHKYFSSVITCSDQERKAMLAEVKQIAKRLVSR
ncbi:MAG: NAD(P)H-dependent oxidoreductase [Candidatus Omnitrophota bacterium]